MVKGVVSIPVPTDGNMLARVATFLARAGGNRHEALEMATKAGAATRIIREIENPTRTKANVPGLVTSDSDVAALDNAAVISASFYPLLRNVSVFYRAMVDGLLTQVPLLGRLVATTYSATSFVKNEGAATPVGRFRFDGEALERLLACAIIVVAKEMLRSMGPLADNFVRRELVRGTAAAVDVEFFVQMLNGAPVIASDGPNESNIMSDLKSLLTEVEPTAESKLLFAMAPDVAIAAATFLKTFPEMTPTGGTMLGVPAMVTDALDAGELVVLDFAAIFGNAELTTVDASQETSIWMTDDPEGDSDSDGSTPELVSMFQTDSVAIIAKSYFGCAKLRANAAAKLTGVNWGGDIQTS